MNKIKYSILALTLALNFSNSVHAYHHLSHHQLITIIEEQQRQAQWNQFKYRAQGFVFGAVLTAVAIKLGEVVFKP